MQWVTKQTNNVGWWGWWWAVSSVFTRTWAVTAASGDYNAGQITNTPAGNISATDVQSAINELDTEKAKLAGGNTFTWDQTFDTNTLFIDSTNDRVWVWTVSPTAKLTVSDNSTTVDGSKWAYIEQSGSWDANLTFILPWLRRWNMGIDNSDSDKFKIGINADLSASSFLSIDTSGNTTVSWTLWASNLSWTNTGDNATNSNYTTLATTLSTANTWSAIQTFLSGMMGLRNVANTFTSFFTNTNTASRTYTLKDASGTLAFTSDITGTNSGTNTGDQNLFQTIAVSGQSNVVADTTSDTLTLVAWTNVTITTDAATDSITISATWGGGSGSPWGANKQVQFNDAGAFGWNSRFTFDKSTGWAVWGAFSVTAWDSTDWAWAWVQAFWWDIGIGWGLTLFAWAWTGTNIDGGEVTITGWDATWTWFWWAFHFQWGNSVDGGWGDMLMDWWSASGTGDGWKISFWWWTASSGIGWNVQFQAWSWATNGKILFLNTAWSAAWELDFESLTANRKITFQDAAGTVAYLSDIGGGWWASYTETEIDFGSWVPVRSKKFTITNASISGTSKIIVSPSWNVATWRVGDDWEWDDISFIAKPWTWNFTVTAISSGRVRGKRKILYSFS